MDMIKEPLMARVVAEKRSKAYTLALLLVSLVLLVWILRGDLALMWTLRKNMALQESIESSRYFPPYSCRHVLKAGDTMTGGVDASRHEFEETK